MVSFINEMHNTRRLVFNRTYPLVSFISRADTPFHNYGILLMRKYCNGILHVQHNTLLCIIANKFFYENSNRGEDSLFQYDSLLIVEVVPDSNDIRRGCRTNHHGAFCSSRMIQTSQYVHLKELLTGCIGHIFPNVDQVND